MRNRYLNEKGQFDEEVVGLSDRQREAVRFFRDLYHGRANPEDAYNFSATDLLPAVASYWGVASSMSSTGSQVKNILHAAFEKSLLNGNAPSKNDREVKNWLELITEISEDDVRKEKEYLEPLRYPANLSASEFLFIQDRAVATKEFFLQEIVFANPGLKDAFDRSKKCAEFLSRHDEQIGLVLTGGYHAMTHHRDGSEITPDQAENLRTLAGIRLGGQESVRKIATDAAAKLDFTPKPGL